MFQELLNLVTSSAQEAVINNPEIPNEQNNAVNEHVTSGILDGLKNQINGGNIADVLKLVGGQGGDAGSNPVVNSISNDLIGSLGAKFGLNSSTASNVISNLLPSVIQQFVGQTNDPNNSTFDINGIFNHLTNGKSQGLDFGNITNLLNGDNAGGLDLSSITNLFSGDNNSDSSPNPNATPQGGGNILDTIGGLFGK